MIPLGVLAASRHVPAGGGGPTTILTSDSFNRADGALDGSYSDAALGGTPLLWYNNASYAVESNQLRSTSALVRYATLNVGAEAMAVSARIAVMGGVILHASAVGQDPRRNSARLVVGADGALTLIVEFAGDLTLGTAPAGTVATGDLVELASDHPAISARVNGVTVISGADPTGRESGTHAGIRSLSTAWRLDDFRVEAL